MRVCPSSLREFNRNLLAYDIVYFKRGQAFPLPMFFFSWSVKEVSHKRKGRRSLSIDQSSFLKSKVFSILKRESSDVVACKFKGDSLLWSNKNCCFGVIAHLYPTLILLKGQSIVPPAACPQHGPKFLPRAASRGWLVYFQQF